MHALNDENDEYNATISPPIYKKTFIDTIVVIMSSDSLITMGDILFYVNNDYSIYGYCFPECHSKGYFKEDKMYFETTVPWGALKTIGKKIK
jgi:hypothetical protein